MAEEILSYHSRESTASLHDPVENVAGASASAASREVSIQLQNTEVSITLTRRDIRFHHFLFKWITKLNMLPVAFNQETGKMSMKTSTTSIWIFRLWQCLLVAHACFNLFRTCQSMLIDGFIYAQTPILIFWTFSYLGAHVVTHFFFMEWLELTVKLCNEFNFGEGRRERGARRNPLEYLLCYFPWLMYGLLISYPVAYSLLRDLPILFISVVKSENALIGFMCLVGDMLTQCLALNIANFSVYFLLIFELNIMDQIERTKALLIDSDTDNLLKAAYAKLRKMQLYTSLMNLCFNRVVYIGKLVCLLSAALGGFASVRLVSLGEKRLLALVYWATGTVGTVSFVGMFGSVYQITKQVEELERNLQHISASKSVANMDKNDRKIEQRKQKECKLMMDSVPKLTLKSGSFHIVERESTPRFCHASLDQAVTLLVTF